MSATWDLTGRGGSQIEDGLYWVFGIIFREDSTFQFEEHFAFFGERPPLEEALEVRLLAPAEASCGGSIPLTLEVTNVTDNVVTIYTGVDFDNYYAFTTTDSGDREEVWNWWAGKSRILPLYTPWLAPGETATFSRSWELQTPDGDPVEPGVYELQARIQAAQVDDVGDRMEFAWSNVVQVTIAR